MRRYVLQKVIGFDKWHLHSLEMRFYARPIIRRLNALIGGNRLKKGKIVEVGCGLGDILYEINWKNKIGYDLDSKAILAARLIHPLMRFKVGSFDEIRNEKISVVVALNFLHTLDETSLEKNIHRLLMNNDIDRIIVDQIEKVKDLSSDEYTYVHSYLDFFEQMGYEREYVSKSYPASGMTRRRILYFKKRENE